MYPKLISFLKRISKWDADHFKVKKFEFSPLGIALCVNSTKHFIWVMLSTMQNCSL